MKRFNCNKPVVFHSMPHQVLFVFFSNLKRASVVPHSLHAHADRGWRSRESAKRGREKGCVRCDSGRGGQADEGSDETTLLHLGLKMRKTAPTKCVNSYCCRYKIQKRLRYAVTATTDSARCLDRHYCSYWCLRGVLIL